MSTNKPTNPAYISHVHLKGYKSIIDTEVELHPGLNIIIGPNGSGKTNFLEFLEQYVTFESRSINGAFEANLKINQKGKEKTLSLKYIGTCLDANTNETKIEIEEKVAEKVSLRYLNFGERLSKSSDFQKTIQPFQPITIISFETPKNIEGLDKNFSLDLRKNTLKLNHWEWSPILFINDFILNNFLNKNVLKKEKLKRKDLLKTLEIDEEVKWNLRKFSIIQDIRLDEGISSTENGAFIYINQIGFEFLINDIWLKWNMLSDGTKRLFYLITQVTLNKGLCLVEEPELGTYPEQLDQIMLFLKAQAEYKQIILTTHAPRVLDHLKDEELNRIIITKYEKDKGTKMRHLNSKEIKHIIEYTENEGYTSDLWTMTDFFEDEASLA